MASPRAVWGAHEGGQDIGHHNGEVVVAKASVDRGSPLLTANTHKDLPSSTSAGNDIGSNTDSMA